MQQTPKVSGPGKLSKRTDIPGDGSYGSRKEINEIRTGAKMYKAEKPSVQLPRQQVVPLTAPTNYPDQPITDGLSVGPGYTPPPQVNQRYAMISKYMNELDTLAAQPDAPEAFKTFLNFLRIEASKE